MLIEKENRLDVSDEEYVDEQEVNKNVICKEIVQSPEVGMYFDSLDNLFECYREYGKQEGFGIMRQSLRSQGNLKFVCISCSRAGNVRSQKQNCLNPNPFTKTGCKAKINASVFSDGKCDEEENEVKCACRLFEFRGVLCKHIVSVFLKLGKQKVPEKYILARWRKDLRRNHTKVKVTYDDWKGDIEAQRYHKLQKKLDDVADLAVSSDKNCALLCNMMDKFQSTISKNESILKSCYLPITNAVGELCKTSGESNGLHSPLAVRRHGRPPKNRKVSKVEKFVSKKKKREDKKRKKQDASMLVGVSTQENTSIQETQTFTSELFHINDVPRFDQCVPYFQYLPPYNLRPPILPNSLVNAQGDAVHYNPYIKQDDGTGM